MSEQPPNSSSYEELIESNTGLIRYWVVQHCAPAVLDKESVDDVLSSVVRQLLTNRSIFTYRGRGAFVAWLRQQTMQKLSEKFRYYNAKKRNPEHATALLVEQPTPSRIAIAREEFVHVESLIEDLPEEQRHVLLRHRIEGLDYAEIAQEMGKTVAAVRQLLYRAMARLVDALDR